MIVSRVVRVTTCVLLLVTVTAFAEPARLSDTPAPVVTVKNATLQTVQNAIIATMLPAGRTPVRQDPNVMVYEFPLSFWQSIGVQMAQGNSGWQQPKGRQTFTMAQMGSDVMVTGKFETVATNMFNASNSMERNNPVVYNEQYLGLQLIAAIAEGRMLPGAHNQLGIQAYKKPTRKSQKIGAIIEALIPGGPAEKAGLVAGDTITHIGGIPTAEQSPDAVAMLGFLQLGEARLQVVGKGEIVVIKVPAPGVQSVQPVQSQSPASLPVSPKTTPLTPAPSEAASGPQSGWWKKQD
ncbi:MAG: hypothetical protein EON58_01265 [Alphaproteobacteria bacterium]|nr:MAG: hypothetical protein EON58_01265 [Alphaproteobacteria bacterium]